jgi:hypothetical protein
LRHSVWAWLPRDGIPFDATGVEPKVLPGTAKKWFKQNFQNRAFMIGQFLVDWMFLGRYLVEPIFGFS